MPATAVTIRLATPADAKVLLAIYAPYVENTAITFEYEPPTLEEFRARIGRTLQRYPYVVAEIRDQAHPDAAPQIAGYAYASPFKARPAYDWAVETSIYVDAAQRRSGVGRALHDALQACLSAQGILNMEACIAMPPDDKDEPHLTCDSARFHTRQGYHLVGRFMQCGFKYQRWYDMIWMEKLIGAHPADVKPIRPFPDLTPEELAACGVRG